jgi:VanZ family protein
VLKKTIFGLATCWTIFVAVLCLVSFHKLPSLGITGGDKYVHFIFHFVFTLLWGYFSFLKQKRIVLPRIALVLFISICYGIILELLQEIYTTTRQADLFDIIANTIGATMAFLVFVLGRTIFKGKKATNR